MEVPWTRHRISAQHHADHGLRLHRAEIMNQMHAISRQPSDKRQRAERRTDPMRHDLGVTQGDGDRVQVPASTAVTACFSESIERMMSFSNSTTRKNARPPANRTGHTWSGIASLPNTACSGGA